MTAGGGSLLRCSHYLQPHLGRLPLPSVSCFPAYLCDFDSGQLQVTLTLAPGICALVGRWVVTVDPTSTEAEGTYIQDPAWYARQYRLYITAS